MKPFSGNITIVKKNEHISFSIPKLSRQIPINYKTTLNLSPKQLNEQYNTESRLSNSLETYGNNYSISLSDKKIKTIARFYRKN